MADIAYVANTNNLLLSGLKSDAEGTFINDASVEVTIKDSAGAIMAGPLTMEYIAASNGNYRCFIPAATAFLHGKNYKAFVEADGSNSTFERIGHWEFPFKAETRTGVDA